MVKRYGTIGHYDPSMGGLAAIAMLTAIMASKPRKPTPPTPDQIAAADKRTEIQKWNDAIEQRKADKINKKGNSHGK